MDCFRMLIDTTYRLLYDIDMNKLKKGEVYRHKESCKCFRCSKTSWNKGKKIQTNTGRTHFKKGQNLIDLTGKTFNRLTVIKRDKDHITKSGINLVKYICLCSCGRMVSQYAQALKKGSVKSCGCFNNENRIKIGKANNGRIREDVKGEKNYNWKGDGVGYFGLHSWLKRNFKKPKSCELCGQEKKRIEWANISKKYQRNRNDFMALCKPCHIKYDSIN